MYWQKQLFIIFTDSVGQEFRQGTVEMVCLCSITSGPQLGRCEAWVTPWLGLESSGGSLCRRLAPGIRRLKCSVQLGLRHGRFLCLGYLTTGGGLSRIISRGSIQRACSTEEFGHDVTFFDLTWEVRKQHFCHIFRKVVIKADAEPKRRELDPLC